MSKNILIPLDGSELGETALAYVEELVAKFAVDETVNVTLFHVITVIRHQIRLRGGMAMSIPYTDAELTQMKVEAMDYLDKIGKKIENDKISVNCKVEIGENPAKKIIQIEQEVGADLVAMSTHGRSGYSRFMIGSISEKVMRGGTVPVLMVRAREE